ncbi:MAG: MoaD/ThiS family protein [archaeon]
MKVVLEHKGKIRKVDTKKKTLGALLKELGYSPNDYIITVNGKISLPTEKIKENSVIKLFAIVSGG